MTEGERSGTFDGPKHIEKSPREIKKALSIAKKFLPKTTEPFAKADGTMGQIRDYAWSKEGNVYAVTHAVDHNKTEKLLGFKIEWDQPTPYLSSGTFYVLILNNGRFLVERERAPIAEMEEARSDMNDPLSIKLLKDRQTLEYEMGHYLPQKSDWKDFLQLLKAAARHASRSSK